MTLVNIEQILGFISEIKSKPTYLHGHTFKYRASLEKSWVKRMMNLKFPLKKGIF